MVTAIIPIMATIHTAATIPFITPIGITGISIIALLTTIIGEAAVPAVLSVQEAHGAEIKMRTTTDLQDRVKGGIPTIPRFLLPANPIGQEAAVAHGAVLLPPLLPLRVIPITGLLPTEPVQAVPAVPEPIPARVLQAPLRLLVADSLVPAAAGVNIAV